jgi:glycerol-3-phosphate O-acyltransferase/dihydroxyacetone phosphate acyltransferase
MRLFYHIQVKQAPSLSSNVPLVIIPNHVNAFIDPVVIGMLSTRKIRFFARGDVFKNRIARWALNDMNISPMYRLSEGYSDVTKIDQTFDECRSLLADKKAILLFPEGICIQDRRVKKFKKGLARIILGIDQEASPSEEIFILPVGLNYSNAKQFRSRLYLNFGEPVSVRAFHEQYRTDKVRAINSCTAFLEKELSNLLVIVKDPANDELFEALAELFTRQAMEEAGLDATNLETEHSHRMALANALNELQQTNPVKVQLLKERVIPYLHEVTSLKLRDHLLRKEALAKMSIKSVLNDFLLMWFGLPLYATGLVLNHPPYKLAKNLAKDKAKNVEFFASIYANAAMFLWIAYYILQLIFVKWYTSSWIVLAVWTVLVPLTGLFVLRFYPVMKKVFGRWTLLGLVKKNRPTAERLIHEREELISMIRDLIKSSTGANPSSDK